MKTSIQVVVRSGRVLILVMLLTLAPAFAEIPTLAAETYPTAVITVAGRTVPLRVGEVVARGAKTSEGLCAGLDYTIRIDAPKRFGYVGVVLKGSADCVLSVKNVIFDLVPRDQYGRSVGTSSLEPKPGRELFGRLGFAASADTYRQIWGKHVVHEQFEVETTAVYQEFSYYESPTSFHSPQAVSEYCQMSGFGWVNDRCAAATELTGPAQVQRYTYGEFRNTCCGPTHSLDVTLKAWINGFTATCVYSGQSLPFEWEDHCFFGRVQ